MNSQENACRTFRLKRNTSCMPLRFKLQIIGIGAYRGYRDGNKTHINKFSTISLNSKSILAPLCANKYFIKKYDTLNL